MMDWAVLRCGLGEGQWADISTAFMWHERASTVSIGQLEGHRQASGADGKAIGTELAGFGITKAFFRESHGGETGGIIWSVEVIVDIPGIEGGVESAPTRAEAQTLFDSGHEWEEIGSVSPVEGLGQLGQDELTPAGDIDSHDPRAITPVEFTHAELAARDRVLSRSWHGVRRTPVVASLAAQLAVWIANWLLGLYITVGEIGFRIVLFDPGDDMLGVENDAIARRNSFSKKSITDQADAIGQEELEGGVGYLAQHAGQVTRGGEVAACPRRSAGV